MPVTLENMADSILPLVSKPNRYLGNYGGAYRKDHEHDTVKVALAFPDCFDLGMSHLGIKILYRVINERDDALADLVFAPWIDMEEQLRRHRLPLFTLESRTPVSDFDVIGFSLQYELHYTTVLNMLDLGAVPILSKDRGEGDPLVLAGGPCAFIPEPMAPFIDAFLIGDGEEAIHGVLDKVALWKKGDVNRLGLLRALAEMEGVYVPSLYTATPNSHGHLVPRPTNGAPDCIKPTHIRDLSRDLSEPAHLVPLIDVTHSRLNVEVMRGCPRSCRFCMPGSIYHPVRLKPHADVLVELRDGMASGGWEEVSLMSLSTSDYKGVAGLVGDVSKLFLGRGVNVSLPSMRPGTLPPQLARTLTYVRKSGLTFAPEAGTERLRKVINKGVSEEEVIESIKIAAAAGWSSVKLYFMIGLPTETDDDIKGIARLIARLGAAARHGRRKMGIKVSVAGFVPKPHTPFQWEAQLGPEEMARRIGYLKRLMRSRSPKMRWRDPETTFLEGLLSRGDRRLAEAVHAAWRKGCRFDGWSDQFMFDKWMEALEETGIDPGSYLAEREVSEPQPWSHVMSHRSEDLLLRERKRAYAASGTVDSEFADARRPQAAAAVRGPEAVGANVEGAGDGVKAAGPAAGRFADSCADQENGGTEVKSPRAVEGGAPGSQRFGKGDNESRMGGEAMGTSRPPDALFGRARRKGRRQSRRTSTCFRLRYAKLEPVRFISHLDVVRAFDRALRKAGLPIAFSQGFSKHPKMAFGPPLAVGLTSTAEYVDLEFSVPQSPGFTDLLAGCLPEGMSVLEVEPHREAKPDSLMKSISSAGYRVHFSPYLVSEIEKNGTAGTLKEALLRADERLRGVPHATGSGNPNGAEVTWREVVVEGHVNEEVEGPSLNLKLRLNVKNAPKVGEIAKELLAPVAFDSRLLGIERTGLWVERAGSLISPFDALTAGTPVEGAQPEADPGVN